MNPDGKQRSVQPKVALLINMIAPYRVAAYARLATYFDLSILHGRTESNRSWGETNVPGACERPVWGLQVGYKTRKHGRLFEQKYFHMELGYLAELFRIRPGAIITCEIGFRTIVALIYGALSRTPVWVCWEGTLHSEKRLDPIRRVFRRIAARVTRRWISWGDTSTEYLLSLNVRRENILQVQNCVDESWYVKPEVAAVNVLPKPAMLFVGRFVALKGPMELLQAAGRLQAEGVQFSLMLVGDGPDLPELKALAAGLEIKNLHFYPFQPPQSMASFYRSADVLVFPTMQDVWGLVANEAVLSGLTVLCSKYAGCATELFPSECIFDPADPEEFLSALRRAVGGQLPPPRPERIKSSHEVADLIAREIQSVLGAVR